jgi:hypothetical protein
VVTTSTSAHRHHHPSLPPTPITTPPPPAAAAALFLITSGGGDAQKRNGGRRSRDDAQSGVAGSAAPQRHSPQESAARLSLAEFLAEGEDDEGAPSVTAATTTDAPTTFTAATTTVAAATAAEKQARPQLGEIDSREREEEAEGLRLRSSPVNRRRVSPGEARRVQKTSVSAVAHDDGNDAVGPIDSYDSHDVPFIPYDTPMSIGRTAAIETVGHGMRMRTNAASPSESGAETIARHETYKAQGAAVPSASAVVANDDNDDDALAGQELERSAEVGDESTAEHTRELTTADEGAEPTAGADADRTCDGEKRTRDDETQNDQTGSHTHPDTTSDSAPTSEGAVGTDIAPAPHDVALDPSGAQVGAVDVERVHESAVDVERAHDGELDTDGAHENLSVPSASDAESHTEESATHAHSGAELEQANESSGVCVGGTG